LKDRPHHRRGGHTRRLRPRGPAPARPPAARLGHRGINRGSNLGVDIYYSAPWRPLEKRRFLAFPLWPSRSCQDRHGGRLAGLDSPAAAIIAAICRPDLRRHRTPTPVSPPDRAGSEQSAGVGSPLSPISRSRPCDDCDDNLACLAGGGVLERQSPRLPEISHRRRPDRPHQHKTIRRP